MVLLDGKTLSQKLLSQLKEQIKYSGKKITLDIVLVGNDESSIKYVALKQQRASEVGIDGQLHHLSSQITELELMDLVKKLNAESSLTGYFIQLPLPNHINKNFVLNSISHTKDADGLALNSGVAPAVVRGIIRLLDEYKLSFVNKNVVVLNDSILVGQPLKKHFESRHSVVTLCNQSTDNLAQVTKTADLLISATGVKNIVTVDMVKDQVVVVDVAGGDVDFENVAKKASFITPTFGGVGPMTVASLLQNTFDLANS